MVRKKLRKLKSPSFSPVWARVSEYSGRRLTPLIVVVVLISALGVHFIFAGHAATFATSTEAENGTIAGKACATSDSGASGGNKVIFGNNTCSTGGAPTSPPALICGNSSVLDGPATAPTGAITVAAGNNSSVNFAQANKTYWFAPGTHTLGTGQFNSISPAQNDVYVGAPGAILDGGSSNNFAFSADADSDTGVVIEHLEIRNFRPPGAQGAINTNSNNYWTIQNNYLHDIAPGAAMMVGSYNTIQDNCMTHNGEYAFNAYQDPSNPLSSSVTYGPQHIAINHNEISFNNTCNWEKDGAFPITPPANCGGADGFDGCGCSGGGKFWAVDQAQYKNNYVHDNYSIGMWADTNDAGFDIEGNYIANNWDEGLIYEISYNYLIKNNNFIGNAIGLAKTDNSFPHSALYISEAGSDSRVPGAYGAESDITGNIFTNNWSALSLWENPNRYCSSSANSSTGDCTIANKSVATLTTCANANLLKTTPYIDDCRWKTNNVKVFNNTFNFTPASVAATCTQANGCGFVSLVSVYGTYAPYTAWLVPTHITNTQNNVFSNNTYNGPWHFIAFSLGDEVSFSQWQAGFNDSQGSGVHINAQDAGSTIH